MTTQSDLPAVLCTALQAGRATDRVAVIQKKTEANTNVNIALSTSCKV